MKSMHTKFLGLIHFLVFAVTLRIEKTEMCFPEPGAFEQNQKGIERCIQVIISYSIIFNSKTK